MKKRALYLIFLAIILSSVSGVFLLKGELSSFSLKNKDTSVQIKLPVPKHRGKLSLEEAISQRRSRREYKKETLTLEEVSQILWAAAGSTVDEITGATRTAPSAGACYPIQAYLIAGEVKGLTSGVYYYEWWGHTLTLIVEGDVREKLTKAALEQQMINRTPASLVFTALYPRTTKRYGERGIRYTHIDMGCIVQNVYLQAEALNLGTVCIGAFIDEAVKDILKVKDEEPLCIMPLGRT